MSGGLLSFSRTVLFASVASAAAAASDDGGDGCKRPGGFRCRLSGGTTGTGDIECGGGEQARIRSCWVTARSKMVALSADPSSSRSATWPFSTNTRIGSSL